jgi:hypothetical protein
MVAPSLAGKVLSPTTAVPSPSVDKEDFVLMLVHVNRNARSPGNLRGPHNELLRAGLRADDLNVEGCAPHTEMLSHLALPFS